MNNTAQITHESETQRQFVRLQLPATADINGNRFTVKDLSSGGMAIRDIDNAASKGDILDLTLILPFADFSLDIDIKAEIQHVDKKTNIAGSRFIDLNSNQVSILNHVIKSFMAGDIVGANDLLNVVSRENFVNVRKHSANESNSLSDKIKKYGVYGFVIVATLLLASFIVGNIMEKLFIVKTPHGYVQANTISILNPYSGNYQTALAVGAISVKKGQVIGTIQTSQPDGTITANNIVSPCDCFIKSRSVLEGEYKPKNAPLFTLLPQESDITINAKVRVEDIHRLDIGTKAVAIVSGVNDSYKGTITDIITNQTPVIAGQEAMALVIIQPDQKIKNDLVDRPAFVEFHL